MKYLMILTVGVCLLFSSVPAMAGQTEDEAAVRKAVEELVSTWNAKDVKAHVALLDETNVPWEFGGKGTREGQEKYLTEAFTTQKDAKGKITKEIGIVFVTPDVAIYKAYGEVTGMVDDDEKPMPLAKGLVAWVMVKKGGQWLSAASFTQPIEE